MIRKTPVLGLLLASALSAPAQEPAPPAPPTPTAPGERGAPAELGGDVKLYSEASLRLHRGEHRAALELFQALLDGYPESALAPEGLFWSASCMERLGRTKEAEATYERLLHLYPDSPWCQDARQRRAPLTTTRPAGEPFRVRLADGGLVQGPLGGLAREHVIVEGRTVPWSQIARLERAGAPAEGAAPNVLLLEGGDRVSGRLLSGTPQTLELDAPACGGHLSVPLARVQRLIVPGTGQGAFTLAAPVAGAAGGAVRVEVAGEAGGAAGGVFRVREGEAGEERVVVVGGQGEHGGPNAIFLEDGDDPVVVLRQDEDGRQVRVVVRKGHEGEKGHRAVIVVRPDDGGEERRIELQLDDLDLDGQLDELPRKIQGQLQKRLGDLDLDLDLDLHELGETLRDAPDGVRKRVHELLERKLEGAQDGAREQLRRARVQVERAREDAPHTFKWRTAQPGQEGGWTQHFYELAQPERLHDVLLWQGQGAERRADADRVVLENGDVLSGELQTVDGERVHMKTPWGEVKIDRRQVARILLKGQDKAQSRLFGRSSAAPVPPAPAVPSVPAVPGLRSTTSGRPFLGVTPADHDGPGVRLEAVHPGTPAAEAGLRAGDVILELDGARVNGTEQLIESIGRHKVGDQVTLLVARGEDRLKRQVTLAPARGVLVAPGQPMPPAPPAPPAPPPALAPAPAPPPPPMQPQPPRRPRRTSNQNQDGGHHQDEPRNF